MKAYGVLDETTVFAETDKAFVEQMNMSSELFYSPTIEEYMTKFANGTKLAYGLFIRSDLPENFVKDLIKHKIIHVELPN